MEFKNKILLDFYREVKCQEDCTPGIDNRYIIF